VTAETIITDDKTIFAQWEEYVPTEHELTVNNPAYDGTDSQIVLIGYTVTLTHGTRHGYRFTGWTVNAGGVSIVNNEFTMPNNPVEITANWLEITITLTQTEINLTDDTTFAETTISGTATGEIELRYNAPYGVTVSLENGVITVTGTPPNAANQEPAIKENFTIQIIREGVQTELTVYVNFSSEFAFDCDYCNDEGCEICDPSGDALYVNGVRFTNIWDAEDEIWWLLQEEGVDVTVTGKYHVTLFGGIFFDIPEGRTLTWNAQLSAELAFEAKSGFIELGGGGEFILGEEGFVSIETIIHPDWPNAPGHAWAAIAEWPDNYYFLGTNVTIRIHGTVTAYSGEGSGATGVVTFGGDLIVDGGTIYASGTQSFAVRKNPSGDTIGGFSVINNGRVTGAVFPADLAQALPRIWNATVNGYGELTATTGTAHPDENVNLTITERPSYSLTAVTIAGADIAQESVSYNLAARTVAFIMPTGTGAIDVTVTPTWAQIICTHDFPDTWTVRFPATCATDGIEYRRCLHDCGYEETRLIPRPDYCDDEYCVICNPLLAPVITITSQPAAFTTVMQGDISAKLHIEASFATPAALSFEWFAVASPASISLTSGASLAIPADLAVGTHYFYAVVSADGAIPVTSNRAAVTVLSENAVTVTFDPSGGIFANPNEATRHREQGETLGNLPVAISRYYNGYRYRISGWFTAPNGNGEQWFSGNAVTANITLYANWVRRPLNFQTGSVFRIGENSQIGDGRVTSADATMIARYIVGQFDNTDVLPICRIAADINGDGIVDVSDITLLSRWLAGHNVRHLIAQ